jgi:hypothetical protein
MKTLISFLAIVALFTVPAFARGSHKVKGYTKKDGTYVAPHKKTNPNKAETDNWGAKGNINPDTGKAGAKEPTK